jgi:peptidyl-prolyl cis-trans isomerase C
MTTSFPETKTGPRLGLVSAAAGCLAMVLLSGLPLRAQDANPVLAKVNGAEIRQSDVAFAEQELAPNLKKLDPAAKQAAVLDYLIKMKLIAMAATNKKIGDSDDFKRSLAFAREQLLMQKLLADEGKAATTEAAMHKVYDEAGKQVREEVHARHILVETEDEAKTIADELKKGADFAELAKKRSKDTTANEDGGDLGFFTREQMVPEFSTVAFSLEPGKISDPVKSPLGWHIIKVEEKRSQPVSLPPFDEIKGSIEEYVAGNAKEALINKLRADAKIEMIGASGQSQK